MPAVAVGHADLRGVTPDVAASPVKAAPEFLRLTFDAPVVAPFADARFDGLGDRPLTLPLLTDPQDPQAALIRLPGVVPKGSYRVRWRVLSADGHASGGAIPLRVGSASAADPRARPPLVDGTGAWLAGAGRGLLLAGMVAVLGLVTLRHLVLAPAWRAGGLSVPGRGGDADAFRDRVAAGLADAGGGWWRAWAAGVAAWLTGGVLLAVGTVVAVRGGPSDIGLLLSGTRTGSAVLVAGGAAVLAAVAGAGVRARGEHPGGGTAPAVALGVPPAAGLVAMSWLGHASSGTDATLNIGADALHNLATAAWVGGLAGLAVLVLPGLAGLAEADRVRMLAPVVVRFSGLAFAAVGVLVVTGVYRALAEVGSLGDLLHTGYGRALSVKLALFAVMLAVGGYNRFRVHPRLERAALGLPGGDPAAAAALRRSVRAELLLAAGVLAMVAVLVSSSPPG